ncbi:MAG: flavin reductase, partial [Rhodoferax sp.]|nr:flavin reductase [Rhodoferax sp.]
ECEVSHVHEWATHHIVIGSVLDVHFSRTISQSLAYTDGEYHAVG